MKRWSVSEVYAVVSIIVLLALVVVNNPVVMLIVSVVGLVAGLLVARTGKIWRPAMVAMAGFGAVLAFSLTSFWL